MVIIVSSNWHELSILWWIVKTDEYEICLSDFVLISFATPGQVRLM